MRNIKALDALRWLGQCEGILQSLLNCFRIGLHDPEALVIKLLGVARGEINERALVATLGNADVDPRGSGILLRHLLGEYFFEHVAIFKIYRNVDISRHVGLADVELSEKGREKLVGLESGGLFGNGSIGKGTSFTRAI